MFEPLLILATFGLLIGLGLWRNEEPKVEIGSHATFLSVSTDPKLCEHIGSEMVWVHGVLECAWCGTPIPPAKDQVHTTD